LSLSRQSCDMGAARTRFDVRVVYRALGDLDSAIASVRIPAANVALKKALRTSQRIHGYRVTEGDANWVRAQYEVSRWDD